MAEHRAMGILLLGALDSWSRFIFIYAKLVAAAAARRLHR